MIKHTYLYEFARPFGIFIFTVLLLAISGIGCPIKFATGISCPGCGLTRAWLAALTLQPKLALAYHPLFWTIPLLLLVLAIRERLPQPLFKGIIVGAIVAFMLVWMVRLAVPHEANVLFSGLLTTDVVSIEAPRWLAWLCHLF